MKFIFKFAIGGFLLISLVAATPIFSTKVDIALQAMLNSEGKFTKIDFSNGTSQTTAINNTRPYIQISDTTNQAPGTTSPTLVTFDSIDEQEGFAFTATTGTITVPEDGVYFIMCGGQVGKASGSSVRYLDLWVRKNSVDIPRTGVRNAISASADTKVVIQNTGIRCNANDVINIYIAVDDITGSTGLYAYSPVGRPVVPGIIFTMFKISD